MNIYVAPSFQTYEKVSDTYTKNSKLYIDIKHPNTGNIRSVRAYTEAEYAKAYGKTVKTATSAPKTAYNVKKILGYGDSNTITIFKGYTPKDEEFFERWPAARYATYCGWYLPQGTAIIELPKHITAIPLSWNIVGQESGVLYENAAERVKKYLK